MPEPLEQLSGKSCTHPNHEKRSASLAKAIPEVTTNSYSLFPAKSCNVLVASR